jgi:hypothetical protein
MEGFSDAAYSTLAGVRLLIVTHLWSICVKLQSNASIAHKESRTADFDQKDRQVAVQLNSEGYSALAGRRTQRAKVVINAVARQGCEGALAKFLVWKTRSPCSVCVCVCQHSRGVLWSAGNNQDIARARLLRQGQNPSTSVSVWRISPSRRTAWFSFDIPTKYQALKSIEGQL